MYGDADLKHCGHLREMEMVELQQRRVHRGRTESETSGRQISDLHGTPVFMHRTGKMISDRGPRGSRAAFALDLSVARLCTGRCWTFRGFMGFPVQVLRAFELFSSSCCCAHEVSCRCRVIGREIALEPSSQYCVAASLSEREGAEEGGDDSSTGSAAILSGDRGSEGELKIFKIHISVCRFAWSSVGCCWVKKIC